MLKGEAPLVPVAISAHWHGRPKMTNSVSGAFCRCTRLTRGRVRSGLREHDWTTCLEVGHTRRHDQKREELRFLFGLVAIAKQRPSSPPIMLSAQRMVSSARRFAVFRAYSDAALGNNGIGQDIIQHLCLNTSNSPTVPTAGRP